MRAKLTFISVAALGLTVQTAGAASPSFLARRDYAMGGQGIAVADVNGDKIPDVLQTDAGSIRVLLGNGNGTFYTGPVSQVGTGDTFFPVAADVNGDGKIDIISAGQANSGDTVYGAVVSLGNGDGTFQPGVCYQAGSDTFLGNAVYADFTGDGIPDIVVPGESGIWLFTGQGGGVFSSGVLTPLTGTVDGIAAAADFNGDGKLDLAVTTQTGFLTLLGNGNGTFQAPQAYSTAPLYGIWLAVGDLNLDGHQDIVLAAYNTSVYVPSSVLVYLGNGSGGFSKPAKAELYPIQEFALADVNGDGIPDLVASLGYVALGRGDGTFRKPVYYPLPPNGAVPELSGIVPFDLRNNGLTDLVFMDPDGSVSVLLNRGKGAFEDGEWTSVQGGSGCAVSADFNGDGIPDLAVTTTAGISILLGTGQESQPFTAGAQIALLGAACMATGDLNGDGIPDLLVPVNGSPNALLAYLGNGNGTFTLKSTTPTPNSGGYVVLADLNNDGHLDFATSGNLMGLGNGDGTFQTPVQIAANLYDNGTNIAAGDVNGDGWTDLVITDSSSSYVYVFLNNGNLAFTESKFEATEGRALIGPTQVLLADLDGDGNLDMVVASDISGAFVYKGNGTGAFTFQQTIYAGAAGVGSSYLVISDINGDGVPDLIMSQGSGDSTVGILLGKGHGTFQKAYYVGAGPAAGSIVLQNLHRQPASCGMPDIAAPDATGGVMVLINLSASTCPGS